ncbi:MAG: FAD-dependent monooxygenase [Leptospiraceae bacterium]|nr:FAD-dependent monooxygenase [Leptospiraceae bacterium]
MNEEKVIIVGAGVAGLSLAIMLAQRNIESVVLESREHFDGPTSGVRISGEGVEILGFMNLEPIGAKTEKVNMRFGSISANFSVHKSNSSAIIVTRQALHEQLMQRALSLGVRMVTNFRVSDVQESADGVQVTSTANDTLRGNLLIGADGVGSTIRQILNSEQESTKMYAGYLGVGIIAADEEMTEMTLHRYPGHEVGVASCGRVNKAAKKNSVFLWTHIQMPEDEARRAGKSSVEAELAARAEQWRPELKTKYNLYVHDAESILAFGPVYNGKPPTRWHSNRIILIGDAAHPYGPGGQGISMALKDARALCEIVEGGFSEKDRNEFQRMRAREARAAGEAAERRNAKAPLLSWWGILAEGTVMKALQIMAPKTLKF